MTTLGVDWGRARTGVAASDELGLLAHPLDIVESVSVDEVVRALVDRARERGARDLVLGLPKNMDGSEGDSAQTVRRLGEALAREGLRVIFWDERLSTWQAERLRREAGGKKRRKTDAMAACVILQGYLDAQRKAGGS